jgi:RimJ/RimL family protein N-acetyltransferase
MNSRRSSPELSGNCRESAHDIVLRAVTESDIPIFYEHQLDPEATRMAGFPPRERDAFSAHWSRILADDSVVTRTIVVDGQVAGNVVSFVQDGQREVGYWLGREHWGRGVATRALALFLGQILTRPLYAWIATENVASRRVLEKCGFAVVDEGSQGMLLALRA